MIVTIPMGSKMSLSKLHTVLNKFHLWFAEYDPMVSVEGSCLVIRFTINKEKK